MTQESVPLQPAEEGLGRPVSAALQLRALRQMLPAATGPLRAREPLRRLCAEIRLEGRIEESLSAAPAHAGPLNSQGVVVRALQRLQGLSPEYLASLMRQVDALAALEALRLGTQRTADIGPGRAATGVRGRTRRR